jgi:hypothetical protein
MTLPAVTRVYRARKTLPKPTDRLPLGGSGLAVSPLWLGLVDDPRTVSAAFEAGVNFFFLSADLHWPFYEGVRRGLAQLLRRRGVRDDIVVGVVTYLSQPGMCWMPLEEALAAVPGLGRVDVSVAGAVHGWDLVRRRDEHDQQRRSGYCGARAIGATFHDRTAALQATAGGLLEIAGIRYNPDHSGARHDVFPFLPARRHTLLYCFNSTVGHVPASRCKELGLAADLWRPHVTDLYRFALTSAALDGLLVAPRTPRQLQGLIDALERGPVSRDEERYLIELARVSAGRAKLRESARTGGE